MTGRPVLSRRRPRQARRQGLEGLVGADVEVRVGAGSVYRGRLDAIDPTYLYLTCHTGCAMLVTRGAVVAVLDEQRTQAPGQGGRAEVDR